MTRCSLTATDDDVLVLVGFLLQVLFTVEHKSYSHTVKHCYVLLSEVCPFLIPTCNNSISNKIVGQPTGFTELKYVSRLHVSHSEDHF